jgi:hypothetical protein
MWSTLPHDPPQRPPHGPPPCPRRRASPFPPIPRQYVLHDGWTPARQIAFIEELADIGSVEGACKAVDMSQAGTYNLRRQPGAESFRKACQAALQLGVARGSRTW